jgi:hypothetical protein
VGNCAKVRVMEEGEQGGRDEGEMREGARRVQGGCREGAGRGGAGRGEESREQGRGRRKWLRYTVMANRLNFLTLAS